MIVGSRPLLDRIFEARGYFARPARNCPMCWTERTESAAQASDLGTSAEPPRFLAVSIEARAPVESNVCQFPTAVLDVVVVCLCGYPDIWRARN